MHRRKKKELSKRDNSRKNIKKGKRRKELSLKTKRILWVALIILAIIVLIFAINLAISTNRWKRMATEMTANEGSVVIDTDGTEIAELGCERKIINVDNIPDNLKNAYVSIEDERFYKHHGVDIKRTGAAILSYVVHFGSSSYGGSTITQQLVKNLTGDSSDSIFRKVREWWKAWQLETSLDKDEILEAYLNVIYVGPNTYGVGAGAKYYFNKTVDELTIEECAFLAGINHSPNSYNPFGDTDNTEKINNRTKTVLAKMLELEYIDQQEYDTAVSGVNKGLKFKNGEAVSEEAVYSYHTDALILDVTEDIADKYNITETFATNYLNMAGLTIKSTQDSSIQEQTETEFEKSKYRVASKNGTDTSQAAMVIIDHETGNVVACVGGLGKKTTARSLNRATQSVRQTGSAIKPLAVLTPGIDKKVFTASTIYDDTERDFADGYHPTDYSKQLGKITVRRAVESSQNIPFVEMMEEIKPKTAIKYLEKMGISTLTEEDNTLVLSLGGLQKGISPLEMAGAYATIANDGQYIEPTFYTEVVNSSGRQVVKTKQKTRKVFSKEVAAILKNILTQPVEGTYGTATYCKISGVDVAAKTGTTDENYDRWLCGFTPYYTAVTWYGFDINETVYYNQRNPAGLLWANVMSRIHAGLQSARFTMPTTVNKVTVCSETGKKARTGCKNTYTEYFLWFTSPGLCDEHSGDELDNTDNETENNRNNTGVIQEITHDIDAVDPQESGQIDENIETNTVTENTPSSTNDNNNTTETNTTTNSIQNNDRNNNTSNTNTSDSTNSTTNTNTTNTNVNTNTSTNENITSTTNTDIVTDDSEGIVYEEE